MIERLRQKWKSMLAGDVGPIDRTHPTWHSKIGQLTARARQYARTIGLGREEPLWPDVPAADDASHVRELYRRLRAMAVALETEGSELYRDEALSRSIAAGLERVYERYYNERTEYYGNWWHWEIGAPLALLDTLVLAGDRVAPERLAAYLAAIDRCTPDPIRYLQTTRQTAKSSTGANRVWKARVCFVSAMLKQDMAGMTAARDALAPVFDDVEEGDGFYADGSFIQHGRFAYTGGYGKSLLSELAELFYCLDGSPWEAGPEQLRTMVRWVEEAFAPFLFRGLMADMTSGREISRHFMQNHHSGHLIIGAVLKLADIVPPEQADRLKRTVKQWLVADTYKDFVADAPLDAAVLASRLLRDDAVELSGEPRLCKLYAAMDRAIVRRPTFAFGIGMFSDRTSPFESINGENLRGWYTAHGMTYLYNEDLAQYADAYWPTVNPYRLPGTTVSTIPRRDGKIGLRPEARAFAGGAVIGGQYGAVGMELEEPGEYGARKSWFLFDDELVCLGSGIWSADRVGAVTTVDNRMTREDGSNVVWLEADGVRRKIGHNEELGPIAARWIQLEGNVPGADIGYCFPLGGPVRIMREERAGSWRDIDEGAPDTVLRRRYLTVWLEHGERARDGTYAYAVLPGRNAEQTAAYASEPQVDIVELSSSAHAVKHERLSLFAAIFWNDRGATAGPVTCDRKASVMLHDNRDTLTVAVADPTQANEGWIRLELDASASEVLEKDERIVVERLQPRIVLAVNVAGTKGTTCGAVFAKRDYDVNQC